jgi:iron(II)-dependent oxidoreductase
MLATRSHVDPRSALLDRLAESRSQTDELFDLVRPDSLYERPIPERHRIIFYLGHLEAFDWNLLQERLLGLKPFHPEFDQLFAFGIDPVGGGLPSDQPGDWPSLEQVRNYVNSVRRKLDEGLEGATARASSPTDMASLSASVLLNVAIEHRLMHAETLAYMLHQLPLERKFRKPHRLELVVPPVRLEMTTIPAGKATLGLSRDTGEFGWDNEFEAHTVEVPAFAIDRHKVTNRQYLEFMAAGGYENHALWSDADWEWKTQHGIAHPAFWRKTEDQKTDDHWYCRTMFDEVPLPLDWPVYVSHAEASAFAQWVGKSLPTEAQWHRAAYGTANVTERRYPWGDEPPAARYGNFDFRAWDPSPAGSFPLGRSAFEVSDLLGNGWEWTSTVFGSFPGFQAFPFYPGYSANFFDGKHYVMKGGSPRTAACMLRRSFRNWFQAHYQYVYSGFRCVSN